MDAAVRPMPHRPGSRRIERGEVAARACGAGRLDDGAGGPWRPAPEPTAGRADAFVADWDAVGTQALTAAALSPADGHTIFAYVAIAVYDSVMAIKGGYKPFAVDADAPGARRRKPRWPRRPTGSSSITCPTKRPRSPTPPTSRRWPPSRTAMARRTVSPPARPLATRVIALRTDDGFRVAAPPYVPPDPPVPGVWLPTAPTPPVGPYLPSHAAFQPDSADQYPPNGPPALSSKKWARDYNEVKSDRLEHEHDPHSRADPRRPVLGRASGGAAPRRAPHVRPRPRARHRGRSTIHGDESP